MSQFYYDDATAETLAQEVAALGGPVACVSCPTLFRTLKARPGGDTCYRARDVSRVLRSPAAQDAHPAVACHLLEFDERYSARGDFTLYDYNSPEDVPASLHHTFDVVVADPPYLSEECFLKTAQCVRRRRGAFPLGAACS